MNMDGLLSGVLQVLTKPARPFLLSQFVCRVGDDRFGIAGIESEAVERQKGFREHCSDVPA